MKQTQILETIRMIEEENLDIRTITMGISLLDCIDSDIDRACEKIYQKITTKAKDLVKVGNMIGDELGIPIINKRVSVTPIAIIGAATDATDYTPFALALDRAAKAIGIDFIGGFTALAQKGYQKGDKILINSLPKALAATDFVCSSVNVGSTKTGINMDAVRDMGEIISFKTGNGSEHFDGNTSHHMHFCCNECGDIYDIFMEYDASSAQNVENLLDCKVSRSQILFYGSCINCLNN